jgi:hypothetical protein
MPDATTTLIYVISAAEIALIGGAGYFLSQLVGNKDSSNDLVKTVLPVTGALGGIVLLHTVLWYFYFTTNPLAMNLYFLLATAFSIIISLTALSIAVVNKS